MIIREARPDEYPAIGELRVTAYQALGLLPEGSEYVNTLRGFGFGTDCTVLVATDEAGVGLLGTIAIEWFEPSSELAKDETEADVRAFAVAPQGQGRGVGRGLLRAAIERADKRGLRCLRLCTNPVMQAAQHLYETTGFTRTPDLDWSPGPDLTLRAYELALPAEPPLTPGTAREDPRAVHSIPATFIEFNGAQLSEPPVTQTPPYQVTDPATGEVAQTFPFATDAEVEQALADTTAAFAQWRKRPIAERAEIVARVGQLFTERSTELAAIITKEMGKRPAQAVGEAEFCTDIFGYYAENGPELLADRPLPGHDAARVEYLPVGPVLGVMPWNYPYYQVARFAAPNLIVGNTIILKHAENCPTSALAVAQIMKDAGVPEGVYVNIFATHEQVATMIADPRLRGVSLTGSERAGTVVAEQAGRNLKKVVLELGGSDPYIILDTDDVNAAAKTAWITRMENVGQACNSNKRMIVMDSVYDDFVAALVKRATGMSPRQAGDDSPTAYSPMVSRKAAENLLAQVQDAVSKGATLHVGGTLADGDGAYFAPAVLTGVTPDMRAYREELFGPVAVVYKVTDDDEAVKLANVVDFGLGGAVFSTDEDRASRVAEQLEVGMANVNTPAGEGADLPFGGTKRSGFGRELGPLGIDEFVNKRLFYVQK